MLIIDPPATAGGTDLLQVRLLTFEAKPSRINSETSRAMRLDFSIWLSELILRRAARDETLGRMHGVGFEASTKSRWWDSEYVMKDRCRTSAWSGLVGE